MAAKFEKVIVCLANSRKLAGRCIAGKEFDGSKFGRWIRPVSSRLTAEVSEEERRFQDGKDPKLLDIIRIPMIEAKPHGFQVENCVIDDGYYWAKEGEIAVADVRKALDKGTGPLWDNSSSSYNGTHDRVDEATAAKHSSSLKLLEVEDLIIEVAVEGAEFGNGKRKVRGHFSHNGAQYKLAITDPYIEREYLAKADGSYRVGRAILCVSLGELYNGFAYKLIAGVII